MNPVVSVVIPTYNSASTLRDCVTSVLAQTHKSLEVIIVDDGSSDDTVTIARSFGGPVVVLTKENGGPASARNLGIRKCSGEFIAFMDSDDLWLPTKVERQVAVARSAKKPALVFTGVQRTLGPGMIPPSPQYKLYSGENPLTYATLWAKNWITTSSVLAHRLVFEDLLFDEDPLIEGAEDFDLWLRIANRHPIWYLDEVLTIYLVSGGGHSRSNMERTYLALNRMYDKLAPLSERHHLSARDLNWKRFELNKIFGIRFFQCGNISVAKSYLRNARSASWYDLSLMYFSLLTFLPESSLEFLRRIKKSRMFGAVNGIARHC
ncbi:glycosyltransferase [Geomonas sp. RF6]|uniref:glycosyltransferase family 2 protein n=1 Tax=Geomonas sp. RF6 TaxID=2897342 RepID=UPI001E2FE4C2|nr:glycosyltransferase [Geomonas sp. RF6]UFS69113.1 glycosyltransferase [Geomonas sp. RF6]